MLNEVLAILDWRKFNLKSVINKQDLLVYFTNQLWQKDCTDKENFANLTNNFDIKESESFKKNMVSK